MLKKMRYLYLDEIEHSVLIKTVKTQLGGIDIMVSRGNYEPKIISKYDRNAEGMEDKILSLYTCGMSQRDIAEQLKGLYDLEISA